MIVKTSAAICRESLHDHGAAAEAVAGDPAWRAQVAALERDASRWTGNDTRVLELSTADAPDDAGSVIDDILRDGIPLAGDVGALRLLRTANRWTR
jgi:hypothetical protein